MKKKLTTTQPKGIGESDSIIFISRRFCRFRQINFDFKIYKSAYICL